jgi:hypothetical protein
MLKNFSIANSFNPANKASVKPFFIASWLKSEKFLLTVLLALAALTWLPRLSGPLDLRYDGSVYYILGTSIAEGKGYKILSEPGEIDAVQYPPLFPVIIAAHQLLLQTSDPAIVGQWLRFSALLIFIIYIYAVFRLFRNYFSLRQAFFATLLCLFSLHVYFLSDLCFPEILFSLITILFVLFNRKPQNRTNSIGAYLSAVASYALRTIGIAVLMVWVLESLLKRQFKQAIVRLALVIIPVACWQFYITSVEKSEEYNHPSYSYQRAPYMFYNVSYTRNIALEDPFAPEKGKARVIQRLATNLLQFPLKLGESIVTPYYYLWENKLLHLFGVIKMVSLVSGVSLILIYILALAAITGLILQLLKRQFIIPLYVFSCFGAICLTPFLQQYYRYIMPVTPFLVLSLFLCLFAVQKAAARNLSLKWAFLSRYLVRGPVLIILLLQVITLIYVYRVELEPVKYSDKNDHVVKQRLFFDVPSFNSYNLCVNYLNQHAQPNDVAASGMPHWIYLQTGLKVVMPPFEINPNQAQQQMDSVPVKYLIVGKDVINSDRYTLPVVERFTEKWKKVFSAPESDWTVYERYNR